MNNTRPNVLPSQKQRIQLTMAELDTMPHAKCKKCGFENFLHTFKLKIVSPLLSQSGRKEVVPIQSFICGSCHTQLMPEDMENETTKPEPELPDNAA